MRLKLAVIIMLMLTLISGAEAAVVTGKVYEWSTLEPINDVIVEINTVPAQSIVVKSGTYTFNAPPGTYTIEAKYYRNNLLEYHTTEEVTTAGDGEFTLDLIMFPALEVEEFFESENLSIEEIFQDQQPARDKSPMVLLGAAALFLAVLILIYLRFRPGKTVTILPTDNSLPEDLLKLLTLLDKSGGRATQKELRKTLDLSEAKVSLMITDLESRGVVKKIKKGRGNVVIRKEGRE
ncbi:MAG TPA: winged helix-turn-helix transcriptional regulator [Euryarchaeota archaeon]|nr:winged helix-turn-helix transcriptional regulator [Euryarchaeota archaeon]